MGEHVAGAGGGELLDGADVVGPRRVDVARRPLRHGERRRRCRRSATPRASGPSPAARRRDSRRAAGDVVHPPPVVVHLETEHHRQSGGLGRQHALDIGVEVGAGVLVPVVGHGRRAAAASGSSSQKPPQQPVGLAEAEEVLGERDLVDARRPGALAVRRPPARAWARCRVGRGARGGGGSRAWRAGRGPAAHLPPEAMGHGG